jgi:hypothetical protein
MAKIDTKKGITTRYPLFSFCRTAIPLRRGFLAVAFGFCCPGSEWCLAKYFD